MGDDTDLNCRGNICRGGWAIAPDFRMELAGDKFNDVEFHSTKMRRLFGGAFLEIQCFLHEPLGLHLAGGLPLGCEPRLGFAPASQVAVWREPGMFGEQAVQRIVTGRDQTEEFRSHNLC